MSSSPQAILVDILSGFAAGISVTVVGALQQKQVECKTQQQQIIGELIHRIGSVRRCVGSGRRSSLKI